MWEGEEGEGVRVRVRAEGSGHQICTTVRGTEGKVSQCACEVADVSQLG